jgi:hypothetical protein
LPWQQKTEAKKCHGKGSFTFVSFATKRNEAGGLGAEHPKYIEQN